MSRMLAGAAAFALTLVLTLPGPAAATERRADGLRQNDAAMTEFSSQRRWHRRHFVRRHVWGPRRAYWGPRRFWGPRYAYPYWRRPVYAYSPYYYRPWRRPYYAHAGFGPVVSFGIGFGPRYWW
jgi:hypothetical protein